MRAYREQLGLAQVALADKMGINRSHISRIEQGNRRVTQQTLDLLAKALRVKPEELLLPTGSARSKADEVRAGALMHGAVLLLRQARELAPNLVDLNLIHELEQVVDWTDAEPS